MTRIAVSADLHIDTYGSKIDAASGLNARLVDFLNVAGWLARDARERGSDALVIAGDFSERRHPSPWLVGHIGLALEGGPDRQIFGRGNHDGEVDGQSIVTVLASNSRNWSGYARPGVEVVGDVAIAVLPYLDRHFLRAQPGMEHVADAEVFGVLAEQYLTIARGLFVEAQATGARYTLLIGHQTLAGAMMSETQQAFLGDRGLVVDARALAAIGYSAIAFGHLHRPQDVVTVDGCQVVYAGSPERVDWGEEHEGKSYVVLDFEDGAVTISRVKTPARRFVTVDGRRIAEPWEDQVEGAIVRIVDLDPAADTAAIRRRFEGIAFEVDSIRKLPVAAPESAGGMSEAMSPGNALETYFEGEPDAPALIEEGRRLLAEVAA